MKSEYQEKDFVENKNVGGEYHQMHLNIICHKWSLLLGRQKGEEGKEDGGRVKNG